MSSVLQSCPFVSPFGLFIVWPILAPPPPPGGGAHRPQGVSILRVMY